MNTIKCIISSIFIIAYFTLIGSQNIPSTNINANSLVNVQDTVRKIGVESEEFALDLFNRVSQAVARDAYDFMISPFSIWALLVLAAEGAKGNTLEELRKVLRLDQDVANIREGYRQIQKALSVNTTTVQASALQALFYDTNGFLNADYEGVLRDTYRAELIPVDFLDPAKAQVNINNYVDKATRGLIDYVVNVDDLINVKMVLISAIFFKGQWKYPFNRSLTTQEPFYDENEKITGKVNMMFQRGSFRYAPIAALQSHAVELPYGKEDRLAMIIILPAKNVLLTNAIERLSKFGINNIFKELRRVEMDDEDDQVEVFLPRFTSTSDFVLNIILEQMGILDAFDQNRADFTKMSKLHLFLSRVFHKTKIEVNEEGTIASAATTGTFANKAQPPRFYINRPFAYIIVEKTTNSLLFCGQVRDPTKFSI